MISSIEQKYFYWLCDLVDSQKYGILIDLYSIPFQSVIPLDDNRADDGINLRYRFGDYNDIPHCAIASNLDVAPCSIFEMMVALALRCEEHIMDDPEIGNRTSVWFQDMLTSLGLNEPRDYRHDEIVMIANRLNNRTYLKNGRGGLFTINDPPRDLRYAEIWYQMMLYLKNVLKKGT